MERSIVLSARRYSFDDGGKHVEGCTVSYLAGDVESQADFRGMSPLSVSASSDIMSELREVPGVYDLEFRQRPGKGGKVSLSLTHARYVQGVDLAALIESAA